MGCGTAYLMAARKQRGIRRRGEGQGLPFKDPVTHFLNQASPSTVPPSLNSLFKF
jgi:hypothetical protein